MSGLNLQTLSLLGGRQLSNFTIYRSFLSFYSQLGYLESACTHTVQSFYKKKNVIPLSRLVLVGASLICYDHSLVLSASETGSFSLRQWVSIQVFPAPRGADWGRPGGREQQKWRHLGPLPSPEHPLLQLLPVRLGLTLQHLQEVVFKTS